MNYKNIYENLIGKAKSRLKEHDKIYDRHHIIPRSFGGIDEDSNIVCLTPREHYIAHLLLLKISTGKERSKMAFALFRFSPKGSSKYGNGRKYELARRLTSSALTGEGNPFFGRHLSKEHSQKISGKNHGMYQRGCYDVWIEKYGVIEADKRKNKMCEKRSKSLSGTNNPMYGRVWSSDRNSAHSKTLTGRKGMFKDGVQKRIKPEDFDKYFALGWSFKV